MRKKSSPFGCLINIIIGLGISLSALTYASMNGIDIFGAINAVHSVVTSSPTTALDNLKNATGNKETSQSNDSITNDTTTTSTTSTNQSYAPLSFKNSRQMVNAPLDSFGRATSGHIQLSFNQKPASDREPYITYDPVGWHNYRFKYQKEDGSISKAWLMNRGHLVGYLFSGLDTEKTNLVPITRYLNAGTISDSSMDSNNANGMLFYEMQLNNWLRKNTSSYLDYYVKANYQGNNLIPYSVTLYWTSFDINGQQQEIKLAKPGVSMTSNNVGTLELKDISQNA